MIHVAMTLNAEMAACRILRQWVGLAAYHEGATTDAAKAVEVAVGEALTNAYIHAYKETAGPLHVDVSVKDRHMIVSVRDEGERVAVPVVPYHLSERESGYGLFLIGQIVDEVRLWWDDGMTIRMAMEFPGLN